MRNDWKYLPLGDIVEIKRGLTYSKNDEVVTSEKIVLRSNNVNLDNHQFDFTELKYLKPSFDIPADKYLQKGDLLMCMSNGSKAHLGKVALYEGDSNRYAFGGFMAALSHKDSVIGKYLFYAMTTPMYKEYIKALSDGANINNLKVRDIEAFTIPVPPLSEQERIVSQLDEQFAKIDALKANAASQLQAAKDLFQSALKQLLTPQKGWEEKKLGEVSTIIGGSTPKTNDSSNWGGNNNWVTPAELNGEKYYGKTKRTISDKAAKGMQLLPIGTVLLSSRAPIGKVAITTEPMYCNQGFKNIVCSNVLYNEYVYWYILFSVPQLEALGVGATFKELSKSRTEEFPISFPSLPEQERITARLDTISEKVKALQANYDQTITLCNDLKQSLLKSIFA